MNGDSDSFIQYGERIRSPWEAKFFAYYWRLEILSQSYIKLRKNHYNRTVNMAALCEFYARAEEFFSKAEPDMESIMKGIKVGKPKNEFTKVLRGLLLTTTMSTESAQRIMKYINMFAAKSGITGQTEKYHKKPFDKIREGMGVKPRRRDDDQQSQ